MPTPLEPYALAKIYMTTGDGRQEQLVLWFAGFGTSGDPPADTHAFAVGYPATFSGALKDCMSAECIYRGFTVSFHQDGVTWTDSSTTNAGVGAEASDPEPEFVAACIQKKTGFPGRSGQGRWFVGSVPESLTTEGRLNATGIGAYETLGTALIAGTGIGACDLEPAVYSALNNDLYVITNRIVDPVLARQSRRRLRIPV